MTEAYDEFRPSNMQPDPQNKGTLTGSEMLSELVDTSGQLVGLSIVDRLLLDPNINRLVIMGQPGAGKTTLLYQVDHSLGNIAQFLEIPVERSIILYDSLLRSARRRKEIPDSPQFNTTLVKQILQPNSWTALFTDERFIPKRVTLAEVPAVGNTKPKDRGVTAFEKLARETEDTLFVYVVAHPLSQLNGLAARFTATIIPIEDVVRELAKIHNIIVEASGISDERILGNKIKNAVKWTARGPHIEAILYEMGNQYRRWRHLDREGARVQTEEILLPEGYNPRKTREQLIKKSSLLLDYVDMHFGSLIRKKAVVRSLLPRIEAANARHRFRELGVPEDRAVVAFNQYQTGPIKLYIKA